jgi:hypothetical protein
MRASPLKYEYFQNPFTQTELDKLVDALTGALRAGGWPYETYELKKDGLKKIILGEEHAPPAVWRYLCAGIEKLVKAQPTLQEYPGLQAHAASKPSKK